MGTITPHLWNPLARLKRRAVTANTAVPESATSSPPAGSLSPAPDRLRHPHPRSATESPAGDSIWVTVLVENSVNGRDLQAEHGLAFHVHTDRWRILFDTGQTSLVLRNAAGLGLPLAAVEAIALSHGHYDHTGGLQAVRQAAPGARVFVHPDALHAKFSGRPDGTARPVGMPRETARELRRPDARVTWTRKPTEVVDGVFLTGEIPRETDFEDTGGRFFLDEACAQPDPLLDDQALFFDTADGVVVLLGCAHAGVVNTLRYIRQVTAGRPIHAVLGGFHLLAAEENRMRQTLDALAGLKLTTIGAAHCTGPVAMARLWTAFPDRCCTCAVGSGLAFRR